MPHGVELLQVAQNVDERGSLCFMEVAAHLPFEIRRVFWISDVPTGKTRGGHAHWTCHEAIFSVSGSFEIEVDDGEVRRTFRLLAVDVPAVTVEHLVRAAEPFGLVPARVMARDRGEEERSCGCAG